MEYVDGPTTQQQAHARYALPCQNEAHMQSSTALVTHNHGWERDVSEGTQDSPHAERHCSWETEDWSSRWGARPVRKLQGARDSHWAAAVVPSRPGGAAAADWAGPEGELARGCSALGRQARSKCPTAGDPILPRLLLYDTPQTVQSTSWTHGWGGECLMHFTVHGAGDDGLEGRKHLVLLWGRCRRAAVGRLCST